MASRKNLKKDIRYIINELITEVYVYQKLNPQVNETKLNNTLKELLSHYNNYIARINKPEGKNNRKLMKIHYNKIIEDLQSKTFPLVDEMG